MKKLFGAVFFVALLLAVSYFKLIREDSKTDSAFQKGLEQGAENRAGYQHQVDSLSDLIEQYELAIQDSQRAWADRSSEGSDSLKAELARRDDVIDSLKEQKNTAEKALAAAQRSAKKASGKKYSHREILTYYKDRYEALPADLSPYEKRIALAEIRQESAKKFHISIEDLNKIRESNNIGY